MNKTKYSLQIWNCGSCQKTGNTPPKQLDFRRVNELVSGGKDVCEDLTACSELGLVYPYHAAENVSKVQSRPTIDMGLVTSWVQESVPAVSWYDAH